MSDISDKVKIIVRTVGERTLGACINAIERQGFDRDEIAVVNSVPFSEALRRSFEIGINVGRDWTFCVDADVILREGSISKMLALAEMMGRDTCEIQGYVLDKFFGGHRPAGNHFYRTEHLGFAISNIPPEGIDIRPEYCMLQSLRSHGLRWEQVPYLVGLHDFYQYYGDIFRKNFVQARKHAYLRSLFDAVWSAAQPSDIDFTVAEIGYQAGAKHSDFLSIDKRLACFAFSPSEYDIREKEEMNLSELASVDVEKIIRTWQVAHEHSIFFPEIPSLTKIV